MTTAYEIVSGFFPDFTNKSDWQRAMAQIPPESAIFESESEREERESIQAGKPNLDLIDQIYGDQLWDLSVTMARLVMITAGNRRFRPINYWHLLPETQLTYSEWKDNILPMWQDYGDSEGSPVRLASEASA